MHLIGVLFCLPVPAPADFTVSGVLPNTQPGMEIQLLREDLDTRSQTLAGKVTIQSNHSFNIQSDAEPGLYSLRIPGSPILQLAVDSGQSISIKADPQSPNGFSIDDSPDTEILAAYESFRKESLTRLVYPPRARLNQATDAGEKPEQLVELAQAEVDGYNAHRRELNDFTLGKVGTSIAIYATSLRWDGDYRREELQKQVDEFARIHPKLAITQSMQNRMRLFARTAIGAKVSSLSGTNLNGESLALDDYGGQIVLLDFWASWCVPCRVENRQYQDLLHKYADQGFQVFAVNLDDSRSAWARASQQDGVTWPNISDLNGLKSPMAKAYNVSALPVSFLLDRDGRILARNLRGELLAEKLAGIFGQSK